MTSTYNIITNLYLFSIVVRSKLRLTMKMMKLPILAYAEKPETYSLV